MHITKLWDDIPIKTKKLNNPILFAFPAILVLTIPAGGHLSLDIGNLFSPAFWSLMNTVNYLLYERFVLRGFMVLAWILQNRSRVISSVPLAIDVVRQLVELEVYQLYRDTLKRIFDLRVCFSVGFSRGIFALNGKYQSVAVNLISLKQSLWQSILMADDFLWHGLYAGFSSGKSCINKPIYSIL